MRPIPLAEVARVLDAELTAGDGGALVRGAAADSRVVRDGDLFFALRGQRDGADFAPEAYLRGAVAAVAARPLEVPTLVVEDVLEAMQRLQRVFDDEGGHLEPAGGHRCYRAAQVRLGGEVGAVGPSPQREEQISFAHHPGVGRSPVH